MAITKGETGFRFLMDSDFVATSYSAATIKIQKPDGTSASHSAAAETDGSDGRFFFTAATGDFDQEGEYLCQLIVAMPDPMNLIGDIERYTVGGAL